MTITDLIIKGDFEVEGMPKKCSSKLKYLRLKARVMPHAFIGIEEFSSTSSKPSHNCGLKKDRNP